MPEKYHLISSYTCPWVQRSVVRQDPERAQPQRRQMAENKQEQKLGLALGHQQTV